MSNRVAISGNNTVSSVKDAVLCFFPTRLRHLLARLPDRIWRDVEEIRVRMYQPLILNLGWDECYLTYQGRLTTEINEGYKVETDDLSRIIQLITNSSLYAVEEELRNGFITLPGGHRVGLSGRAVVENGKVRTLKYISGLNFRISKEIQGAADTIIPYVVDRRGCCYHTLIVSPPKCGKTTVLRDLIRQLSYGIPSRNLRGQTVGLVDERSEIAGAYKGVPQHDVGPRTDVLDACPKAEGMMMLLRALSPQVMATDEIGRTEDVAALEEVLNAGVKILATAHASSIDELKQRPVLKRLMDLKLFERYILLCSTPRPGTLKQVIDGVTLRPLGG